MSKLLTLPHTDAGVLSIRAKALVFDDARSAELLVRAEQIAASDATVLIIGETGTGKELLARHVHNNSGRSGPFIAVNCGAFSESLVDAELFGHESGAFTGAAQARQGWFEAANGGTLFLDEIGDLPLAMQVKLLRVLQERQVVRLGSRKPISLDVRLIAATNVDLHEAVRSGHFRSDLYYRLGVATLVLPPLCQRPGDILPLARHFIDVYAKRLGLGYLKLTREAEQALLQYDWPGNIRELENVIHYGVIVSKGGLIHAEDLHLGNRAGRVGAISSNPVVKHELVPPANASLEIEVSELLSRWLDHDEPSLFERFEAALIKSAYAACRENQVQTARALGISRNVLRTHLKHHGLLDAGGKDQALSNSIL